MKIWSDIARLGAVVAAFGPPVLTKAENEVNQVDLPTLGVGEQPSATLLLEVPASPINDVRDVDENAHPDPTQFENPHVADVPQHSLLPLASDSKLTANGKNSRATLAKKTHSSDLPWSRGWHGGGQRYGSS